MLDNRQQIVYYSSMNKGKKLVTYWTITGKVRKYEQRIKLSDRLTPFCILLGIGFGCLYIRHYFDNFKSDFIVRATNSEEAPVSSPAEQGVANNAELDSPKPTTTPTPTSQKQEIIDYIVEVFGEDAPDAFNVLYCENRGLNPNAVNHNRNGSRDLGIFQLNDKYHGGEENFDWKLNIDKAYKIFKSHGKKWTAWTCSKRVDQKNYLGE